MKSVDPIRDLKKVEAMKIYLRGKKHQRLYLICFRD